MIEITPEHWERVRKYTAIAGTQFLGCGTPPASVEYPRGYLDAIRYVQELLDWTPLTELIHDGITYPNE